MTRVLSVAAERFPIAGTFTISRGSKTEAEVIACTIGEAGATGRGECVPYRHYGETIESVSAAIEGARDAIERGAGRAELQRLLPAGAARNALDCALWDLEAKLSGSSVASRICAGPPRADRNRLYAVARHAGGDGGTGARQRASAAAQGQDRRRRRHCAHPRRGRGGAGQPADPRRQ